MYMCKYLRENLVVIVIFVITLSLSVWGILAYDYNLLTINKKYYGNWPETAKNLSYSIITGWIIYAITVTIPYWIKLYKRSKTINERLTSLNIELSFFFESANISDNRITYLKIQKNGNSIISAKSIPYLINEIPWDESFPNNDRTYKKQAIVMIRKIYLSVSDLAKSYDSYLSENQSKNIDTIIGIVMEQNWGLELNIDGFDIGCILKRMADALQKSIGLAPYENK